MFCFFNVADLKDKGICAVFSQFSFTKWSLDTEEEPVAPFFPPEDDDFAFDVNAVPEPVPAEENEAPVDHFEGRLLYFVKCKQKCSKFCNYKHMQWGEVMDLMNKLRNY